MKTKHELSVWSANHIRRIATLIAPLAYDGPAREFGRRVAIGLALRSGAVIYGVLDCGAAFWATRAAAEHARAGAIRKLADLDTPYSEKLDKAMGTAGTRLEQLRKAANQAMVLRGSVVAGLGTPLSAGGMPDIGLPLWMPAYAQCIAALQALQRDTADLMQQLKSIQAREGLQKLVVLNKALESSARVIKTVKEKARVQGGAFPHPLPLLRDCWTLVERFAPDQMPLILASNLAPRSVQYALEYIGSGPNWEDRREEVIEHLRDNNGMPGDNFMGWIIEKRLRSNSAQAVEIEK